ncbi:MAG: hypothetical protein HY901_02465, partial [Deltaproteobacteria bacterium]|nr:hypothetical protein [Deltaproteobacteria bacterium]
MRTRHVKALPFLWGLPIVTAALWAGCSEENPGQACIFEADCPQPSDECLMAACAAGRCINVVAPDGTATASGQVFGDCHQRVCTGGVAQVVDDASDPTSDDNACTSDTCQGGQNMHAPAAGSCQDGAAKVCGDPAGSLAGKCVECNADQDCAGGKVCDPAHKTGTCVAPECDDGAKDGDETDVDCGGSCAACPRGYACENAADCQSGFCSALKCAPCADDSHCDSGRFCDVAGGGICQPDKAGGGACEAAAQCESGHCADGVCCDSQCEGACQACSAAKKGEGADGVCGSIQVGTDPDDECEAEPASSCGQTGLCNGAGACASHGTSTVCVPASCAAATAQPERSCDGAGTCVEKAPVSCGLLACNSAGTACLVTCAQDLDCTRLGDYCRGTECTPKLVAGTSCIEARECSSGNCVDQRCCATACAGACEACDGAGFEGECVAVPAGADPASECAGTDVCSGTGACTKAAGTQCAADGECLTHHCVDGLCCDTQCLGTCRACDVAGQWGACTEIPAGADPADECPGATACGAGGACVLFTDGTACASDPECGSGHCADEVCCDAVCDATCLACTAAKKGSGEDGVCGPSSAGTDPDEECATELASSCGMTGACSGAAACALYPATTVCLEQSCAAGTLNKAHLCSGAGACVEGGTEGCGAYACNAAGSACLTTCSADADCAAGTYCDGSSACVAKKADGGVCASSNVCSSGSCVDGVCCNSACTGPCQACSAAKKGSGADGVCGPIGVNTDPDSECIDQGAASCGTSGVCDGAGACSRYASGTVCLAQSCAGSTLSNARQCNG